MAGIGFELRRILNRDSYSTTLQAYLYAGLISAGPWVLSIISILIVGLISLSMGRSADDLTYFLVTVTYMMCSSLVVTGGLQLMFTRFVADRTYEDREDVILGNFFGTLLVATLVAGALALLVTPIVFYDRGMAYRLLVTASFVILCNLWMAVVFLSGLKSYNRILITMGLGYTLVVLLSVALSSFGSNGLLIAFLAGHSLLLFAFMYDIIRNYPGERLLAFDFLQRKNIRLSLLFTGVVYYLGLWVDKFVFWFNPATSDAMAGMLRSSAIYDIPIFLAYITIIPGMAVFFVRFETDFAECYSRYYGAILEHQPLETLVRYKVAMIDSIRLGISEIIKVQSLTVILLFLWTEELLEWLGMSPYYQTLLEVDMIAVGIQVVMMSVMNVFFYLDKRADALILACLFLVTNLVFSLATQQLHPATFGYGFLGAVSVTTLFGMLRLNRIMANLQFETFMLR